MNEAIKAHLRIKSCQRCSDPECAYNMTKDYSGDLNAMHDAEKSLDRTQCFAYHDILRGRLPARADMKTNSELWTFHASAAERAEAFLRTVSKWKEAE